MITPSTIYWITRFDDIRTGLATLAIAILVLAALALVLFLAAAENVAREHEMECAKLAFCLAFALVLLAAVAGGVRAFVPTTKDAAAMAVLPALANSEKVQTVGNAVYDLAVEWLEELRPAKKEVQK